MEASSSDFVYHTFDDKNAFAPFGAVDIDLVKDGVDVDSAEECKQRCSMDEACDCVTFLESDLKCWKRRDCVISKMTSTYNDGYTVFMKSKPRGALLGSTATLGGTAAAPPLQGVPAAGDATLGADAAAVPAVAEPPLPAAGAAPADPAVAVGTPAAGPEAEAGAAPPLSVPGVVPPGTPLPGGFTMYQNLNAFEPFGCTDLTTNDDTAWGSEEECMSTCAADENCDCFTFERATGGCWMRCNCVLTEMTSGYNDGFNVYVKDAGSSGNCRASTVSTTEHVDGAEYVPTKQYVDELIWFDNFDGEVLDESKWDIREGDPRVNDELQAYRRGGDNLVLTGRSMIIKALCEEYKGAQFTSVKLHSKQLWRSGHRVEAKVRMSTGVGTWPAFWLMGSGDDWPSVGELDILEYTGCANEVMGNLHFRNRNSDNPVNTYRRNVDASAWHTYRVDWVPDGMTFYVDDQVVGHVASAGSYSAWPYNTNEYFIIINLAIGGSLGGPCLNDGVQPSCNEFLEVDWVRVSRLQ